MRNSPTKAGFLQSNDRELEEDEDFKMCFRCFLLLLLFIWPKLTWKKLTEKDCCEWKLTTVDPQERSTRSAVRAASQLPERGPTDVDDAPRGFSGPF